MKVVFASTPDQEQKIKELIQNVYSNVFPLYFLDDDIKEFESLKVLHTTTRHFEYFGTLKEAYQVIVSLQTIIAILESRNIVARYEAIFDKNVRMLQELGLSFPFEFSHFYGGKMFKSEILSIYTKAANELLI
ncbi:YhcU family protein [Bacillus sp. FJAT-29790]|uniref:YhcU family protein n=1 Tax=Bacillus sp. FJAT-29790 TaxID=1895002 RepID=UPI001C220025|nr:YhcU family protein [Bacillus sp. FJAT-29790]